MVRQILLAVLILLLPGCEKENFTQPASFEVKLSATEAPVMGGRLTFGEIVMRAGKVEIEGRRSAGEDVFFERNLQSAAYAIRQHPTLLFDIPQGIYNRLSLNLTFNPDEEKEEDFEEELDDILDDLTGVVLPPQAEAELGELILEYSKSDPAFICSGTYRSGQEEFELLLVVNDPFNLNITAVNGNGTREIVLESDKSNTATLHFDLEKWFSIVPAQLIEKSVKGKANGKEYVLIHKKVNPGLFNMLYNRMAQYTTLVINE